MDPLYVEMYDGDEYKDKCSMRSIPDDYALHLCPKAELGPIAIKRGTGCPNRRFGCGYVAPMNPPREQT